MHSPFYAARSADAAPLHCRLPDLCDLLSDVYLSLRFYIAACCNAHIRSNSSHRGAERCNCRSFRRTPPSPPRRRQKRDAVAFICREVDAIMEFLNAHQFGCSRSPNEELTVTATGAMYSNGSVSLAACCTAPVSATGTDAAAGVGESSAFGANVAAA